MIAHTQTLFGDGSTGALPGNCMQTAVASLLDLPMEDVPHFVAEEDWWSSFLTFIYERGLRITIFEDRFKKVVNHDDWLFTAPLEEVPIEPILIACGYSPRGFYYDVLWQGGKLLHDVHPSRDGFVDAPDQYWLIEPKNS